MATAVRRSNTDGIAPCGMSRATPEATGRRRRHWATTGSVLPQRPTRQQQTKQQQQKWTSFAGLFDGRGGVPVRYRVHCPMEEVQGFDRSHLMLPSGDYCSQLLQ